MIFMFINLFANLAFTLKKLYNNLIDVNNVKYIRWQSNLYAVDIKTQKRADLKQYKLERELVGTL